MATLLALGGARAQTMDWLATDYEPAWISRGPQAGQGFLDRMLSEVIWPGLPAWQHRPLQASTTRLMLSLKSREDACALGVVKTPERSQQMRFSSPLFRYPSIGIVVRRADLPALAPFLDRRGALSLSQWLGSESPGRLGVIGARAYGEGVDELLRQHPQRLTAVQHAAASRALLAMLAREREVDAALAHSFEVEVWRRHESPQANPLAWMPIQEGPPSGLGYVACSDSAQGRQVIEALDALLRRPGTREQLQQIYEEWLEPEARQRLQQQRRIHPKGFWREDRR